MLAQLHNVLCCHEIRYANLVVLHGVSLRLTLQLKAATILTTG